MELWYGCALGLSALGLLAMAITRFGTKSTVDRLLCGLGAIVAGWFAFHMLFRYEGGRYQLYWAAFVLPVYVAYRLVQGFRNREADAARRVEYADAVATANEWRSQRRW